MIRHVPLAAAAAVVAAACFVACSSGNSNSSTSNGAGSTAASTGGMSTGGASTGGASTTHASTSAGGATSSNIATAGSTTGGATTSTSASNASNANSGGSSSSSAGGSSSATGEGGAGSGTGFFTDGFESDATGSQPAGFGNLIDYIKDGTNPNSSGDLATVDTTQVHGGSHAAHFHVAAGSNNPSFLTYTLPSGTNTLYMRAWVYLSRQLGGNAASDNDNHETLFALNGAPGNVNNEVRFGAIKGTVGVNESSTDNITPLQASWNGPPSIPATTWTCLEVAFLGAPTQNEFHAWMNDADLFDITTPTQWQNGSMPANWLSDKFVEIDFGWQSFSGFGADVWVDDLVLGNDRIGCN